jgi:uncharacterized protein (DUF1015 family)
MSADYHGRPICGTDHEDAYMSGSTTGTLQLRPFRGVRYAPHADLARVIAPPYDVIDEAQQRALEASDQHNIVRVILPREPIDQSTDRYTSAAHLFEHWLADGVVIVDDTPALYVYQQTRDGLVIQRGLVGAVVMQPLDGGVILPHENVRVGPVEDRLALMRALQGNPEPIFLLYDGGGRASARCADAVRTPALATALAEDGTRHDLWSITDEASLADIADDLAGRHAMIADGHHRYTTYGYLRDELRSVGAGDGPWDAGLTLLVDNSVATPDIRAIHRVVPGLSFATALSAAGRGFRVVELGPDVTDVDSALGLLQQQPAPAFVVSDGAKFAMLVDPDAHQLAAAKPPAATREWWSLDASIASELVLATLWQVTDAAGEVEAEHSPQAALELARSTSGTALLLNPAPLEAVMAVASVGAAMPRKSTLFLPKPQSGMVMRLFRFDA